MSENSSTTILSDCTDTSIHRSLLGNSLMKSPNLNIENETVLQDCSNVSVGWIRGEKTFIERVKTLQDTSGIDELFPEGALSNVKMKKRKKKSNKSFDVSHASMSDQDLSEQLVSNSLLEVENDSSLSQCFESHGSPNKTKSNNCSKAPCMIQMSFKSPDGDLKNCSLSELQHSVNKELKYTPRKINVNINSEYYSGSVSKTSFDLSNSEENSCESHCSQNESSSLHSIRGEQTLITRSLRNSNKTNVSFDISNSKDTSGSFEELSFNTLAGKNNGEKVNCTQYHSQVAMKSINQTLINSSDNLSFTNIANERESSSAHNKFENLSTSSKLSGTRQNKSNTNMQESHCNKIVEDNQINIPTAGRRVSVQFALDISDAVDSSSKKTAKSRSFKKSISTPQSTLTKVNETDKSKCDLTIHSQCSEEIYERVKENDKINKMAVKENSISHPVNVDSLALAPLCSETITVNQLSKTSPTKTTCNEAKTDNRSMNKSLNLSENEYATISNDISKNSLGDITCDNYSSSFNSSDEATPDSNSKMHSELTVSQATAKDNPLNILTCGRRVSVKFALDNSDNDLSHHKARKSISRSIRKSTGIQNFSPTDVSEYKASNYDSVNNSSESLPSQSNTEDNLMQPESSAAEVSSNEIDITNINNENSMCSGVDFTFANLSSSTKIPELEITSNCTVQSDCKINPDDSYSDKNVPTTGKRVSVRFALDNSDDLSFEKSRKSILRKSMRKSVGIQNPPLNEMKKSDKSKCDLKNSCQINEGNHECEKEMSDQRNAISSLGDVEAPPSPCACNEETTAKQSLERTSVFSSSEMDCTSNTKASSGEITPDCKLINKPQEKMVATNSDDIADDIQLNNQPTDRRVSVKFSSDSSEIDEQSTKKPRKSILRRSTRNSVCNQRSSLTEMMNADKSKFDLKNNSHIIEEDAQSDFLQTVDENPLNIPTAGRRVSVQFALDNSDIDDLPDMKPRKSILRRSTGNSVCSQRSSLTEMMNADTSKFDLKNNSHIIEEDAQSDFLQTVDENPLNIPTTGRRVSVKFALDNSDIDDLPDMKPRKSILRKSIRKSIGIKQPSLLEMNEVEESKSDLAYSSHRNEEKDKCGKENDKIFNLVSSPLLPPSNEENTIIQSVNNSSVVSSNEMDCTPITNNIDADITSSNLSRWSEPHEEAALSDCPPQNKSNVTEGNTHSDEIIEECTSNIQLGEREESMHIVSDDPNNDPSITKSRKSIVLYRSPRKSVGIRNTPLVDMNKYDKSKCYLGNSKQSNEEYHNRTKDYDTFKEMSDLGNPISSLSNLETSQLPSEHNEEKITGQSLNKLSILSSSKVESTSNINVLSISKMHTEDAQSDQSDEDNTLNILTMGTRMSVKFTLDNSNLNSTNSILNEGKGKSDGSDLIPVGEINESNQIKVDLTNNTLTHEENHKCEMENDKLDNMANGGNIICILGNTESSALLPTCNESKTDNHSLNKLSNHLEIDCTTTNNTSENSPADTNYDNYTSSSNLHPETVTDSSLLSKSKIHNEDTYSNETAKDNVLSMKTTGRRVSVKFALENSDINDLSQQKSRKSISRRSIRKSINIQQYPLMEINEYNESKCDSVNNIDNVESSPLKCTYNEAKPDNHSLNKSSYLAENDCCNSYVSSKNSPVDTTYDTYTSSSNLHHKTIPDSKLKRQSKDIESNETPKENALNTLTSDRKVSIKFASDNSNNDLSQHKSRKSISQRSIRKSFDIRKFSPVELNEFSTTSICDSGNNSEERHNRKNVNHEEKSIVSIGNIESLPSQSNKEEYPIQPVSCASDVCYNEVDCTVIPNENSTCSGVDFTFANLSSSTKIPELEIISDCTVQSNCRTNPEDTYSDEIADENSLNFPTTDKRESEQLASDNPDDLSFEKSRKSILRKSIRKSVGIQNFIPNEMKETSKYNLTNSSQINEENLECEKHNYSFEEMSDQKKAISSSGNDEDGASPLSSCQNEDISANQPLNKTSVFSSSEMDCTSNTKDNSGVDVTSDDHSSSFDSSAGENSLHCTLTKKPQEKMVATNSDDIQLINQPTGRRVSVKFALDSSEIDEISTKEPRKSILRRSTRNSVCSQRSSLTEMMNADKSKFDLKNNSHIIEEDAKSDFRQTVDKNPLNIPTTGRRVSVQFALDNSDIDDLPDMKPRKSILRKSIRKSIVNKQPSLLEMNEVEESKSDLAYSSNRYEEKDKCGKENDKIVNVTSSPLLRQSNEENTVMQSVKNSSVASSNEMDCTPITNNIDADIKSSNLAGRSASHEEAALSNCPPQNKSNETKDNSYSDEIIGECSSSIQLREREESMHIVSDDPNNDPSITKSRKSVVLYRSPRKSVGISLVDMNKTDKSKCDLNNKSQITEECHKQATDCDTFEEMSDLGNPITSSGNLEASKLPSAHNEENTANQSLNKTSVFPSTEMDCTSNTNGNSGADVTCDNYSSCFNLSGNKIMDSSVQSVSKMLPEDAQSGESAEDNTLNILTMGTRMSVKFGLDYSDVNVLSNLNSTNSILNEGKGKSDGSDLLPVGEIKESKKIKCDLTNKTLTQAENQKSEMENDKLDKMANGGNIICIFGNMESSALLPTCNESMTDNQSLNKPSNHSENNCTSITHKSSNHSLADITCDNYSSTTNFPDETTPDCALPNNSKIHYEETYFDETAKDNALNMKTTCRRVSVKFALENSDINDLSQQKSRKSISRRSIRKSINIQQYPLREINEYNESKCCDSVNNIDNVESSPLISSYNEAKTDNHSLIKSSHLAENECTDSNDSSKNSPVDTTYDNYPSISNMPDKTTPDYNLKMHSEDTDSHETAKDNPLNINQSLSKIPALSSSEIDCASNINEKSGVDVTSDNYSLNSNLPEGEISPDCAHVNDPKMLTEDAHIDENAEDKQLNIPTVCRRVSVKFALDNSENDLSQQRSGISMLQRRIRKSIGIQKFSHAEINQYNKSKCDSGNEKEENHIAKNVSNEENSITNIGNVESIPSQNNIDQFVKQAMTSATEVSSNEIDCTNIPNDNSMCSGVDFTFANLSSSTKLPDLEITSDCTSTNKCKTNREDVYSDEIAGQNSLNIPTTDRKVSVKFGLDNSDFDCISFEKSRKSMVSTRKSVAIENSPLNKMNKIDECKCDLRNSRQLNEKNHEFVKESDKFDSMSEQRHYVSSFGDEEELASPSTCSEEKTAKQPFKTSVISSGEMDCTSNTNDTSEADITCDNYSSSSNLADGEITPDSKLISNSKMHIEDTLSDETAEDNPLNIPTACRRVSVKFALDNSDNDLPQPEPRSSISVRSIRKSFSIQQYPKVINVNNESKSDSLNNSDRSEEKHNRKHLNNKENSISSFVTEGTSPLPSAFNNDKTADHSLNKISVLSSSKMDCTSISSDMTGVNITCDNYSPSSKLHDAAVFPDCTVQKKSEMNTADENSDEVAEENALHIPTTGRRVSVKFALEYSDVNDSSIQNSTKSMLLEGKKESVDIQEASLREMNKTEKIKFDLTNSNIIPADNQKCEEENDKHDGMAEEGNGNVELSPLLSTCNEANKSSNLSENNDITITNNSSKNSIADISCDNASASSNLHDETIPDYNSKILKEGTNSDETDRDNALNIPTAGRRVSVKFALDNSDNDLSQQKSRKSISRRSIRKSIGIQQYPLTEMNEYNESKCDSVNNSDNMESSPLFNRNEANKSSNLSENDCTAIANDSSKNSNTDITCSNYSSSSSNLPDEATTDCKLKMHSEDTESNKTATTNVSSKSSPVDSICANYTSSSNLQHEDNNSDETAKDELSIPTTGQRVSVKIALETFDVNDSTQQKSRKSTSRRSIRKSIGIQQYPLTEMNEYNESKCDTVNNDNVESSPLSNRNEANKSSNLSENNSTTIAQDSSKNSNVDRTCDNYSSSSDLPDETIPDSNTKMHSEDTESNKTATTNVRNQNSSVDSMYSNYASSSNLHHEAVPDSTLLSYSEIHNEGTNSDEATNAYALIPLTSGKRVSVKFTLDNSDIDLSQQKSRKSISQRSIRKSIGIQQYPLKEMDKYNESKCDSVNNSEGRYKRTNANVEESSIVSIGSTESLSSQNNTEDCQMQPASSAAEVSSNEIDCTSIANENSMCSGVDFTFANLSSSTKLPDLEIISDSTAQNDCNVNPEDTYSDKVVEENSLNVPTTERRVSVQFALDNSDDVSFEKSRKSILRKSIRKSVGIQNSIPNEMKETDKTKYNLLLKYEENDEHEKDRNTFKEISNQRNTTSNLSNVVASPVPSTYNEETTASQSLHRTSGFSSSEMNSTSNSSECSGVDISCDNHSSSFNLPDGKMIEHEMSTEMAEDNALNIPTTGRRVSVQFGLDNSDVSVLSNRKSRKSISHRNAGKSIEIQEFSLTKMKNVVKSRCNLTNRDIVQEENDKVDITNDSSVCSGVDINQDNYSLRSSLSDGEITPGCTHNKMAKIRTADKNFDKIAEDNQLNNPTIRQRVSVKFALDDSDIDDLSIKKPRKSILHRSTRSFVSIQHSSLAEMDKTDKSKCDLTNNSHIIEENHKSDFPQTDEENSLNIVPAGRQVSVQFAFDSPGINDLSNKKPRKSILRRSMRKSFGIQRSPLTEINKTDKSKLDLKNNSHATEENHDFSEIVKRNPLDIATTDREESVQFAVDNSDVQKSRNSILHKSLRNSVGIKPCAPMEAEETYGDKCELDESKQSCDKENDRSLNMVNSVSLIADVEGLTSLCNEKSNVDQSVNIPSIVSSGAMDNTTRTDENGCSAVDIRCAPDSELQNRCSSLTVGEDDLLNMPTPGRQMSARFTMENSEVYDISSQKSGHQAILCKTENEETDVVKRDSVNNSHSNEEKFRSEEKNNKFDDMATGKNDFNSFDIVESGELSHVSSQVGEETTDNQLLSNSSVFHRVVRKSVDIHQSDPTENDKPHVNTHELDKCHEIEEKLGSKNNNDGCNDMNGVENSKKNTVNQSLNSSHLPDEMGKSVVRQQSVLSGTEESGVNKFDVFSNCHDNKEKPQSGNDNNKCCNTHAEESAICRFGDLESRPSPFTLNEEISVEQTINNSSVYFGEMDLNSCTDKNVKCNGVDITSSNSLKVSKFPDGEITSDCGAHKSSPNTEQAHPTEDDQLNILTTANRVEIGFAIQKLRESISGRSFKKSVDIQQSSTEMDKIERSKSDLISSSSNAEEVESEEVNDKSVNIAAGERVVKSRNLTNIEYKDVGSSENSCNLSLGTSSAISSNKMDSTHVTNEGKLCSDVDIITKSSMCYKLPQCDRSPECRKLRTSTNPSIMSKSKSHVSTDICTKKTLKETSNTIQEVQEGADIVNSLNSSVGTVERLMEKKDPHSVSVNIGFDSTLIPITHDENTMSTLKNVSDTQQIPKFQRLDYFERRSEENLKNVSVHIGFDSGAYLSGLENATTDVVCNKHSLTNLKQTPSNSFFQSPDNSESNKNDNIIPREKTFMEKLTSKNVSVKIGFDSTTYPSKLETTCTDFVDGKYPNNISKKTPLKNASLQFPEDLKSIERSEVINSRNGSFMEKIPPKNVSVNIGFDNTTYPSKLGNITTDFVQRKDSNESLKETKFAYVSSVSESVCLDSPTSKKVTNISETVTKVISTAEVELEISQKGLHVDTDDASQSSKLDNEKNMINEYAAQSDRSLKEIPTSGCSMNNVPLGPSDSTNTGILLKESIHNEPDFKNTSKSDEFHGKLHSSVITIDTSSGIKSNSIQKESTNIYETSKGSMEVKDNKKDVNVVTTSWSSLLGTTEGNNHAPYTSFTTEKLNESSYAMQKVTTTECMSETTSELTKMDTVEKTMGIASEEGSSTSSFNLSIGSLTAETPDNSNSLANEDFDDRNLGDSKTKQKYGENSASFSGKILTENKLINVLQTINARVEPLTDDSTNNLIGNDISKSIVGEGVVSCSDKETLPEQINEADSPTTVLKSNNILNHNLEDSENFKLKKKLHSETVPSEILCEESSKTVNSAKNADCSVHTKFQGELNKISLRRSVGDITTSINDTHLDKVTSEKFNISAIKYPENSVNVNDENCPLATDFITRKSNEIGSKDEIFQNKEFSTEENSELSVHENTSVLRNASYISCNKNSTSVLEQNDIHEPRQTTSSVNYSIHSTAQSSCDSFKGRPEKNSECQNDIAEEENGNLSQIPCALKNMSFEDGIEFNRNIRDVLSNSCDPLLPTNASLNNISNEDNSHLLGSLQLSLPNATPPTTSRCNLDIGNKSIFDISLPGNHNVENESPEKHSSNLKYIPRVIEVPVVKHKSKDNYKSLNSEDREDRNNSSTLGNLRRSKRRENSLIKAHFENQRSESRKGVTFASTDLEKIISPNKSTVNLSSKEHKKSKFNKIDSDDSHLSEKGKAEHLEENVSSKKSILPCPKMPSTKQKEVAIESSHNSKLKRSRIRSECSTTLDSMNKSKRRKSSNKTIDDLSNDTLDVTEIPKDKLTAPKKVIYHSTPINPILENKYSKRITRSNKESNSRNNTGKIIQVSKSIFGSFSSGIEKRKFGDLTAYSDGDKSSPQTKRKSNDIIANNSKKFKDMKALPLQLISNQSKSEKKSHSNELSKITYSNQLETTSIQTYSSLGSLAAPNSPKASYSVKFKQKVQFRDFSSKADSNTDIRSNEKISISRSDDSMFSPLMNSFDPVPTVCSSHEVHFRDHLSFIRRFSTSVDTHLQTDQSISTEFSGAQEYSPSLKIIRQKPKTNISSLMNSSYRQKMSKKRVSSHVLHNKDIHKNVEASFVDSEDNDVTLSSIGRHTTVSEVATLPDECFDLLAERIRNPTIGKLVLGRVSTKKHNKKMNYTSDPRFFTDGMPYSFSQIKLPAKWMSIDLYKHFYEKLKPNYDIEASDMSLRLAGHISATVSAVNNLNEAEDIDLATLVVRHLLVKYKICNNILEYCTLIQKYTPFEFQRKVLPLGGYFNSLPNRTMNNLKDLILNNLGGINFNL